MKRRHDAATAIQGFLRDRFAQQMIAASALSFRDYNNQHAAAAVRIAAVGRGFVTRRWAARIRTRLHSCDGLEAAKTALTVRTGVSVCVRPFPWCV